MMKAVLLAAAGFVSFALLASSPVSAAAYGTAAEARALLERAVIEVKADPAAAMVKFNDPKGAFRDRDLYVFCANVGDGILMAHPNVLGSDLRTIKDKNGKPFGVEMFDKAREGEITEVGYVWPRPDGGEPIEKSSYITRIGDQVCGVGYYK